MLTEIKDVFDKINRDRFVIGYDMSQDFIQLSYSKIDGDSPETFSTTLGKEDYNIPFALLKKYGTNQWVVGHEAVAAYEEGEGELIWDVLPHAVKEENILVDKEEYRAGDLLALFLRKSLAYLSVMATPDKVAQIVITVRDAEADTIRTLQKAVSMLKINPEKVSFINYEESLFFYSLNQGGDLQKHHIMLCDSTGGKLMVYKLERNHFLNPAVVTVERYDYDELDLTEQSNLTKEQKDSQFLAIMESLCESTVYSGVFLIGEGFYDDWCRESLRYLCKGRKVYKGNNLFSKGACYAAKEKANPSGYEKNIRFLGKDRLKASVGVEVQGSEHKNNISLAKAGEHWYEVKKQCELILKETDVVSFTLDFANRRSSSIADFHLEGLPVRANRITRIYLEISMTADNCMKILIRDLGFGEIFPSTGMEWVEEMELN